MEDTLRLQFGTAATALGTQWAALERVNGAPSAAHVLAFEAKGRVKRQNRPKTSTQEESTWTGGVQVYDQSEPEPTRDDGLWDWNTLTELNLVELDELRPHMPLHNFYEGHTVANGGMVGNTTMEDAADRVRAVLETCDRLRFVQALVDMDSSWGGWAHEMLTYVAEECPGAVVMTVGNDWKYPLESDDALFRVAADARDQSKVEARRRINVASSVALLSEVSTLLVPVAMSSTSLASWKLSHRDFDRSSYGDVGSVVATALETALSVYRGRSAYEIVEGFQPSMKVVELAASFPHTADPTTLLQSINDSTLNEVRITSAEEPFYTKSLLPLERPSAKQLQERYHKVHYRRLHFRGAFASYPYLCSAIDSSPLSSRDVTLQWSETAPLVLPENYRLQSLRGSSVDAVSQLSSTSDTGYYLSTLAQRVSKNDKRTLYEFTRAGMSPDAPEELEATLAGMGDAFMQQ